MISKLFDKRKKSKQLFFDISALLAGLPVAYAFAPYHHFWLLFPLLAWLFLICVYQTPGRAFRRGWLFGFGWFVHGVHWVYYSLHYHGGTPDILAAFIVALLAAYLALFPALAMYLAQRFFVLGARLKLITIFPALWLLSEWLRGYLLTGFPWLQMGYSQLDTPLAGYAPLIGGLGISGLIALTAGLLASLASKAKDLRVIAALVLVWVTGFGLQSIDWTRPEGDAIKVSLIQGNIPQSEKWKLEMHRPTLELYRKLTQKVWDSKLIIWPETAIPDFQHRVPFYLDALKKNMEFSDQDLLLGLFIRDADSPRYYNSVISIRDGVYRKRHLVPLGEYFPLRGALEFLRRWIDIPMSDVDAGPRHQPLITAAGQKLGVSICFEDAFDRDVMLDLPEASLLVNVSNDAWFEDSPQAWQHHQIARMRALEAGRYMLRSTNTGVSSVIDPKGQVRAISPRFEQHVLKAAVQPYAGSTPYVIWQNYLTVGLLSLLLVGVWYKSGHLKRKRE